MSKNVIRRKSLEPRPPSEADRDCGVQSVDRTLSILETLAEDDEGYRLSDLAIRTGLSASTVHRLLTLESRRSCSSTAPSRNGTSARAVLQWARVFRAGLANRSPQSRCPV